MEVYTGVDKTEVKRITDFLIEVRKSIAAGGKYIALQVHLTELHRVIQRLTDAAFAAQDQKLKVRLAGLEYEARLCQNDLEGRLGMRN
jgi:hypothetical protein